MSTNKHLISETTLCISLDCIYIDICPLLAHDRHSSLNNYKEAVKLVLDLIVIGLKDLCFLYGLECLRCMK